MRRLIMVLVVACALVMAGSAEAGKTTIDFEPPEVTLEAASEGEQGYKEGDRVGVIDTGDNVVTLQVGDGVPEKDGYIATVGLPVVAFTVEDGADCPLTARSGKNFLSDSGTKEWSDYFISFANPVRSVGLDFYDFRADGWAHVGDTAVLTAYSPEGEIVGQSLVTVVGNELDGNCDWMEVNAGESGPFIQRAELIMHTAEETADRGVGIDNVTFETADIEPPEISDLSADPASLSPANHRMVEVTLSASVTDNMDDDPSWSVTGVQSDEAEEGPGDNNSPDCVITGADTVELRAERVGSGDGRTYTITITARDDSGNESSATVEVTVPHPRNRGRRNGNGGGNGRGNGNR